MGPFALYAAAFLAPFVQEDAAVIGTASAAAAGQAEPALLLAAVWAGLLVSDGWKYGAGRLAHRIPWAAQQVARPRVAAARDAVLKRLGMALVTARFVPGTRIPLYLACGVFRAPAVKFLALIGLSASAYVGLCYGLFVVLGASLGEEMRQRLPWIAGGAVCAILLLVWGGPWLMRRMRARHGPALELCCGRAGSFPAEPILIESSPKTHSPPNTSGRRISHRRPAFVLFRGASSMKGCVPRSFFCATYLLSDPHRLR
jgi:membrane protein DedA with SNARE-associated domain